MALRLVEAKRIVEVAIERARELGAAVCVAVCDPEGRLIVLNRMDGAVASSVDGAIGKAIVASSWGRPSGEVEGFAVHPRGGTVAGEGAPVIRRRGALPIFRGGAVEGACGVSGAHDNTQDEECARAGIARL